MDPGNDFPQEWIIGLYKNGLWDPKHQRMDYRKTRLQDYTKMDYKNNTIIVIYYNPVIQKSFFLYDCIFMMYLYDVSLGIL